jgi:L-seryl-tRNA(Ser) seleniumtransferase
MCNPLRNLPAVTAVLNHPDVEELLEDVSRTQVTSCVRSVLHHLRQEILQSPDTPPDLTPDSVALRTIEAVQSLKRRRLNFIINATGIVLHTNLGRAVLSDSAIIRLAAAARATNVEFDLETGKRSRRGAHTEDLLRELTGAPAALIVNNCAAATMLALQAVAAGREVIISRGQLVEIGGGFRLPEVFEAAGVILREVGTSNRTTVQDYEDAINEHTGAILRVHRSNFRVSGFVAEPTAAELVTIAQQHGLTMIDDLGSGCLTSLTPMGLDEPDVASSLQSKANLVLFSGDKLLGGPQAGILIGQTEWIERLRKHPMARAIRVCKLTLAALEATLEEHLSGGAFETIPVLSMLSMPDVKIKERCDRVVNQLSDIDLDLSVAACDSEVGGGSLADQKIASFAVQVSGVQPDKFIKLLRTGDAAVLARIEDGSVLLDLRSVRPEDDPILVKEILRIVREPRSTDA